MHIDFMHHQSNQVAVSKVCLGVHADHTLRAVDEHPRRHHLVSLYRPVMHGPSHECGLEVVDQLVCTHGQRLSGARGNETLSQQVGVRVPVRGSVHGIESFWGAVVQRVHQATNAVHALPDEHACRVVTRRLSIIECSPQRVWIVQGNVGEGRRVGAGLEGLSCLAPIAGIQVP